MEALYIYVSNKRKKKRKIKCDILWEMMVDPFSFPNGNTIDGII